jgi:hypothetical protein
VPYTTLQPVHYTTVSALHYTAAGAHLRGVQRGPAAREQQVGDVVQHLGVAVQPAQHHLRVCGVWCGVGWECSGSGNRKKKYIYI